jgi:hypothetical protein
MYDPGRAAVQEPGGHHLASPTTKSPTQSEEDRAADTTLHEELMHLFGEVPTERIVDKIRGKLGDEDAEMRILIGRMAVWALCSNQDIEQSDLHRT